MNSAEIRQRFLDYFARQGHQKVESASLVPDNDPTLLFTNSGMVQFKEALALREKRGYTRAASCQRCVRAGGKHNDLDRVGYTARHHTFFEMLGNFSFGDYFKREAIRWAWDFLTKELGLPEQRLWVTIHSGDDEAAHIWLQEMGVSADRFSRLGDDDNFWTMGDTGPCGPCSEIFYDHGPDVPGGPPGSLDDDLDRYVEIWNLVFTQYDRSADGTLTPLPRPCVDTGMGLERVAAALQGVHSNYDTDIFRHMLAASADCIGTRDLEQPSLRVIADHIRSAAFLIVDGVLPSNEGRGYVLRRIIRRALRHGHKLQADGPFFHRLVPPLVQIMGDAYPALRDTAEQVGRILHKEEEQFALTLDQGMRLLARAFDDMQGDTVPGDIVFRLYDTYGFPVDLTNDIARERGYRVDLDGFDAAMAEQRRRARAADKFSAQPGRTLAVTGTTTFHGYQHLQHSGRVGQIFIDDSPAAEITHGQQGWIVLDATPFYAESGGQVGDQGTLQTPHGTARVLDTVKQDDTHLHRVEVTDGRIAADDTVDACVDARRRHATRLNHSATHLLHAALREILGNHVQQRGSLVDAGKLRFDFSHFEPVTADELHRIERLVNAQIRANTEIHTATMPIEQARQRGAMALFGEKYSEQVRVLTMGENDFSIELCGGTHADRTGDIGLLKILAEQGIASGVRRIEAVTGERALDLVDDYQTAGIAIAEILRADRHGIADKVRALQEANRDLEKRLDAALAKLALNAGTDATAAAIEIKGVKLLVSQLGDINPKVLPETLDQLRNKLGSGIVVLAATHQGKAALIAGITPDLTNRLDAVELIRHLAAKIDGKGGGRRDMARAGGTDTAALPAALDSVRAWLQTRL